MWCSRSLANGYVVVDLVDWFLVTDRSGTLDCNWSNDIVDDSCNRSSNRYVVGSRRVSSANSRGTRNRKFVVVV